MRADSILNSQFPIPNSKFILETMSELVTDTPDFRERELLEKRDLPRATSKLQDLLAYLDTLK